ncbi:MAG: virulence RhuM family protein [Paludibacteraceae bacterium]|nr:virulence RhuM family protein [Paludibacteraceae bacterium]
MFENQNPQKGEVVMYQPNETIRIEVRMENETVWLTQAQMAELFGTQRQAITKHIKNIYDTKELEKHSTCSILELVQKEGNRLVHRKVELYNLDTIISVGYRVNTQRGIEFRKWASQILKDHLLRGYSFNRRIEQLESRVSATESKIDFFVRTSLPPVEGVFSDGQIFDAYTFACDLIRSAKRRLVLIDNYVDDTVLEMFSKRQAGVDATIYTAKITSALHLDVARYNAQHPPLTIQSCRNFHDRFLLVDDKVYHIGASLKDLGKRLFAFSLLADFEAGEILSKITI